MSCLICERIEMIEAGTNPYFFKELETGYVVIGDFQHFYGRTIFLCKKHVTELHYLEPKFKLKHLFPRQSGNLKPYANKVPVWWVPLEVMEGEESRPSEQELAKMVKLLKEELESRKNELFIRNWSGRSSSTLGDAKYQSAARTHVSVFDRTSCQF